MTPVFEDFGVGTANIPAAAGQAGDLSRANTRKALEFVEANVGLLGTQETSETADNQDIDTVLPPSRWYHFQPGSENDLLVKRSRWRPVINSKGVERTHVTKLSDGKAHVFPDRNLTDVYLEWVDRPEWDAFAFADTHLDVVKDDSHAALRQHNRSLEFDELVVWAAQQHDAGRNCILVLDSNWGRMPKLHADWVWVGEGGNIDKCGYLNSPKSNWELSFISEEAYKTPSDHKFRAYNLRATEKVVVPPAQPHLITTDEGAMLSVDGNTIIYKASTYTRGV